MFIEEHKQLALEKFTRENVGNDQNVSNAFICGHKKCNLLNWFSAIEDAAIMATLPSFPGNLSKITLFYCVSVMTTWVRMPWILYFLLHILLKPPIDDEKTLIVYSKESNNLMKRSLQYAKAICRYQYTGYFSFIKPGYLLKSP